MVRIEGVPKRNKAERKELSHLWAAQNQGKERHKRLRDTQNLRLQRSVLSSGSTGGGLQPLSSFLPHSVFPKAAMVKSSESSSTPTFINQNRSSKFPALWAHCCRGIAVRLRPGREAAKCALGKASAVKSWRGPGKEAEAESERGITAGEEGPVAWLGNPPQQCPPVPTATARAAPPGRTEAGNTPKQPAELNMSSCHR